MPTFKDITGQKFGRLTVIQREKNQGKKVIWRCRCDCGNEVSVWSVTLFAGKKRSCGCLYDDWREERQNELVGKKFGRITVIKWIPINERDNTKKNYLCQCDCGKIFASRKDLIKSGRRVSCGCYNKEISKAGITKKHGKYKTRIYGIWDKMKLRCTNKNTHEFSRYGGRGIRVCDDWTRENGFQNFYNWAMSHGYTDELTLDRIDVNGNYEPSNCRWITNLEQQNNKRTNIFVDCGGEKLTIAELSRKYDIPYTTMTDWVKRQKLNYEQILDKIAAR